MNILIRSSSKAGYHTKNGPELRKRVEYGKEETLKMAEYQCSVCLWIYDPVVGDLDGGIAAGTPFEEIPDEWKCPICGASKSEFEKV